jgi:hypothetical protein
MDENGERRSWPAGLAALVPKAVSRGRFRMAPESKLTKDQLVAMLRERGFSARRVRAAVHAVFGLMAKANREMPLRRPAGGWRSDPPASDGSGCYQHDFKTNTLKYWLVDFGKVKRKVRYFPMIEFELESEKEKRARLTPKPETPEEKKIRELVSELLGRPATAWDLRDINAAFQQRWHPRSSLIARLENIKPRFYLPISIGSLTQWVFEVYWL